MAPRNLAGKVGKILLPFSENDMPLEKAGFYR
jgi:hypothetical protein